MASRFKRGWPVTSTQTRFTAHLVRIMQSVAKSMRPLYVVVPEPVADANVEMHAESGRWHQSYTPGAVEGDAEIAATIALEEGHDGEGHLIVACSGQSPLTKRRRRGPRPRGSVPRHPAAAGA